MSIDTEPLPQCLTDVWPDSDIVFTRTVIAGKATAWGTTSTEGTPVSSHFEGGLLDGRTLAVPSTALRLWAADLSALHPESLYEYICIHAGTWRLYSVTKLAH